MRSTYGECLKLSIFGQSHDPYIGMTLEGAPADLPIDLAQLQSFLNRRAPGNNPWSTPRKEADLPEFQSGICGDATDGSPITAIIHNHNTRSGDYDNLKNCPRPGHADYTAYIKYGDKHDFAGGGHFSGRLTAPLCIAGGLCKQWLSLKGIQIGAHIASIGAVSDEAFDPMDPALDRVNTTFPTLCEKAGEDMKTLIANARSEGDSVGGIIECAVTGLPMGLGGAMFAGMESRIAAVVYGIPGVKGVDFGAGFGVNDLLGSQNNDPFTITNGQVRTQTNHAGGILGGITNGMPMLFRVALKPTPSIAKIQQSVDLSQMTPVSIQVKGRHDPCIVPRAVPVVEAAAAIAIFDAYLLSEQE